MKKIYKTPMIRVTEVHASTMLAASNMGISSSTETTDQWVKGSDSDEGWEDEW